MRKLYLKSKLELLEVNERNYVKSNKIIRGKLTAIKSAFLISFVPTIIIIILASIIKIIIISRNNGISNIASHIKLYHFLIMCISLVLTYLSLSLLLCIPIFINIFNKNFLYISSLLRFSNILNMYSKENKIFKFYLRFCTCVVIYVVIIFSLFFAISILLNLFIVKIPYTNIFNTCTVIVIAILLFSSIYILPESDEKQKYVKNHAKFLLWLVAFGLSIYTIYNKYEATVKADGLGMIFNAITILISMERMYNSYKKLEEVYEDTSNRLDKK